MLKITEAANDFIGYMVGKCLNDARCTDVETACAHLAKNFPQYTVYRGGHHVAVINKASNERLVLVTE